MISTAGACQGVSTSLLFMCAPISEIKLFDTSTVFAKSHSLEFTTQPSKLRKSKGQPLEFLATTCIESLNDESIIILIFNHKFGFSSKQKSRTSLRNSKLLFSVPTIASTLSLRCLVSKSSDKNWSRFMPSLQIFCTNSLQALFFDLLTRKAITVLGTISFIVFLTVPKQETIKFLITVVSMFARGEL